MGRENRLRLADSKWENFIWLVVVSCQYCQLKKYRQFWPPVIVYHSILSNKTGGRSKRSIGSKPEVSSGGFHIDTNVSFDPNSASWSKRWVVYSVSPHPVTRLGESGKGIQVICQPRKSCKKTCKFTKYKLLIILWCGKWPVNIAYFGKLRRTKLGRHFLVTIQWLQPRISGHESVAVLFGDSKDVTSLKVGQIQSSIDIILIHILTIHYVSLCTGKVHNCSILSCWLDYLVGWSLAFILDWKMSTTQCNAISVCLRHESLSV